MEYSQYHMVQYDKFWVVVVVVQVNENSINH